MYHVAIYNYSNGNLFTCHVRLVSHVKAHLVFHGSYIINCYFFTNNKQKLDFASMEVVAKMV